MRWWTPTYSSPVCTQHIPSRGGGVPRKPYKERPIWAKAQRRFPLGIPGLWQHKCVHSSALLCSPKASQCPSLRPEGNSLLGFQESLSILEPMAPAETVGPEEAPGGSLWDALRTTASSGGAPTPRRGTEVRGLGNAGWALFMAQGPPSCRAPGTWEVLGPRPAEDGHAAVRSAWGEMEVGRGGGGVPDRTSVTACLPLTGWQAAGTEDPPRPKPESW